MPRDDEQHVDDVARAHAHERVERASERRDDGAPHGRRRVALEPLDQRARDAQPPLAKAGRPLRVRLVVAHVAVDEVEQRAQATERQRRGARGTRPPHPRGASPRARGSTRPCGRAAGRAPRRRPASRRRRRRGAGAARGRRARAGSRRGRAGPPATSAARSSLPARSRRRRRSPPPRARRATPAAASSTSRARPYASLAPAVANAFSARSMWSRSGSSSRPARARSRAISCASASAAVVAGPLRAAREQLERAHRGALRERRVPELRPQLDDRLADVRAGVRPARGRAAPRPRRGSASAARGSPHTKAAAAPGSRLSIPWAIARRASASAASGATATCAAIDVAARRHSVGVSEGARASSHGARHRRHPRGEQPARDGDVPPHERLAIGEQAVPGRRDGVRPEDAQACASSPYAALARRLARRALEEPRRQATRRQRPGRRLRDPLARELAPRRERQRERRRRRRRARSAAPSRARAARASPGLPSPLPVAERHPRRDRRRTSRASAAEEPREHAPPELALLVPERAAPRRARRAPTPAACGASQSRSSTSPSLERRPHPGEQRLRVQPLERPRSVLARRLRERRHRLAPRRPPLGRLLQLVKLEQAADVEGRVAHVSHRLEDPGERCEIPCRSPPGRPRTGLPRPAC